MRLLNKSLALEFAAMKVRVNSVHPGLIDTHMGDEVLSAISSARGLGDNEVRAVAARLHPLGHVGAASNIADAIVFLASDKAAFMTGSEVVVDGGLTAQ